MKYTIVLKEGRDKLYRNVFDTYKDAIEKANILKKRFRLHPGSWERKTGFEKNNLRNSSKARFDAWILRRQGGWQRNIVIEIQRYSPEEWNYAKVYFKDLPYEDEGARPAFTTHKDIVLKLEKTNYEYISRKFWYILYLAREEAMKKGMSYSEYEKIEKDILSGSAEESVSLFRKYFKIR